MHIGETFLVLFSYPRVLPQAHDSIYDLGIPDWVIIYHMSFVTWLQPLLW